MKDDVSWRAPSDLFNKNYKQMKYFLSTILVIKISMQIANGQMIMTKDSVMLGDRSIFISGCVEGVEEKIIQINGIKIDAKAYCTCLAEKLIPRLYSYEIEEAMSNENGLALFLRDDNLEVLMECIEGNIQLEDEFDYSIKENQDLQKSLAVKICIEEVMTDTLAKDIITYGAARDYCRCAIEKLYNRGMTYEDIKKIDDETSKAYQEIALPCMNLTLSKSEKELQNLNSYYPSDITGREYLSKIDLKEFNGQYALNITIDILSNDFVLDTSSTQFIITKEMEQKLLDEGIIHEEDYLDYEHLFMDGDEIISAGIVELNDVIIGDYQIDNIKAVIVERENPVCGRGLLGKLRKWEFKADEPTLIIYK